MKKSTKKSLVILSLLLAAGAYGFYDYLNAPRTLTDGEWTILTRCTWLPNGANDGDSFYVLHKGKEYVFRLYYVDAPESSDYIPERVDEQAAYFGISREATLALGEAATAFVIEALSRPFTVTTLFRDAMGSSRHNRYFAFVTTSDGDDLGLLLVANGLARVHGVGVQRELSFPAAEDAGTYKHALYSARKKAREQGQGGWKPKGDAQ